MFLERWWIGALTGGVAAALIIFFRPHFEPLYRTEVSLLFESRKAQVVNMQNVVETGLQNAAELNTHMEQLRSNTFFKYVLSSFTPEESADIQKAYRDPARPEAPPPSVGDIIRPYFSVYARRGAPIIGISVTNRSPEAAALIANRLALKYIDYKLDSAETQTNSAIRFLQDRAEELRTQVEQAQARLQDFREKNNLATLGESQNVVVQKVQSLGNSLVRAEIEQLEAKNLIDKIDEYVRTNRNLTEIPQILGSGQVSTFAAALNNLKTERIMMDQDFGVEHPRIKLNELQIVEAQRRLDEAIKKAISDLRARNEVADQLLQRLRAERIEAQDETRKLDRISTEYALLAQDANDQAKAYANITSRLTEAKITRQLDNTNIGIFDPAYIPGAPADTGLAAVTMKASAAGLGLLFLLPLGLGLFDTRIRTPIHVEEGLQEPLLGAVKRMRKMGETQRAQVFRLQKEKDLAEAYLGIFSEIEVRSSLGFPKTLLITSSVPAEGKSLLCSNLAAVFASHKRKTLLVDCDLRRPTLHRYFGVKVDTGWVQWLETPVAARPASPLGIVAVSDELHLLPAGRTPNNPTELLDRLSRRDTLQPLLQNYDIVIFDTPPAAVFPDALLLARSCHEMIYVCRYRTVRLAIVRKVLERFRDSGISTLGIVLNQLPETKARAYGYHGYGTQSADYYKAYADKPEA
ncbi:MAG TPA: polysaccharide biosynthesis tyrosine autokinase [Opitutaceae bacterium]|nr:polysaccharide biosynthesis tyrosine autokinase [Opitutaceae bacterium]